MTSTTNALVSVILPTDTFETIAPVLESLRRLEDPERLEVILVSNEADAVRAAAHAITGFHSLKVCQTDSLAPLGAARAVGVEASSAPYVFLGETHSYLWPDALAPLLAPLVAREADLVLPGFINGNPVNVFSWACFLIAYSRWGANLPSGSLAEIPAYDFLGRRDVLVDLGGDLPFLLSAGDALNRVLRKKQIRCAFVPSAHIDHINLEDARTSLHEHFLLGIAIGAQRAKEWGWPVRLVYLAGSWLVPFLLMARTWHGVQPILATKSVPIMTVPAMLLIFGAKAVGEMFGYAGLGRRAHTEMQAHYEIRRLDYASPCEPR
jgi:hypothetical protein